jgi:hypothetical protein
VGYAPWGMRGPAGRKFGGTLTTSLNDQNEMSRLRRLRRLRHVCEWVGGLSLGRMNSSFSSVIVTK